jgi:hypothetical protein
MTTPRERFLTLDEAATILRLEDRRTVIAWGKQGRIRVIGERRHLLVSAASIDAYERGESPWHARQNARHAGSLELARSDATRAVLARTKHRSDSETELPATIVSLPPIKRRRT